MFLVPTRPCEQIYWHDFGDMVSLKYEVGVTLIRATSHTRPSARDRYTSSTLIGGKGGAGPSSSFTLRLRDQQSM
jgi:hypothetical protein